MSFFRFCYTIYIMLSSAKYYLVPLLLLVSAAGFAQPPVVHPAFGTSWTGEGIKVTFMTRKQQFSLAETQTLDRDIHSPKSVIGFPLFIFQIHSISFFLIPVVNSARGLLIKHL